MCESFQASPEESHLCTIKRLMRYLVDTQRVGLWYPKGSNCDLVGYFDSDFTRWRLDKKITSDKCHFLRDSIVSRHNKKQVSVTLSITEAEYIDAVDVSHNLFG